jgi:2-methylcitrate dehydratase PrpD
MTETRRLAAFAATLRLPDVPSDARAQALRCVLETLGCALGGARSPLTQATLASALRQAEGGCATVIGLGRRAAPDRAAFLNAVSANALDFDGGIVRQGHYGPTAVSAALAVGELVGASGPQLLEAVIAGYEVVSRVGRATRASEERRRLVSGYGPHQGFAAVAAAGRLLGLDPDRMTTAFGLYAAFAPLPSAKQWNWDSRPLSWTKDMVAWPCMAGINAALLAESGFVGPRAIFEGDRGFFRMAGSDRYAPEVLTEGLGRDFEVRRLYFKPYPCCRWSHAAVDAVSEIVGRRGWHDRDVRRIQVGVAREVLEDLRDFAPSTLVDAEFSLPYAAALALLRIPPGPGWHDPALRASPTVEAAMRKVGMYVDPGMDRAFVEEGLVGAVVQVEATGGETDGGRVDVARGGPERPMTDAELEAKFRLLAADVLDEPGTAGLLRMILALEDLPRVTELGARLAGGCR